ncbi:tetratricopeptide repeat protein [Vibrio coralliilyticus]|uniref:tetratricopeptide repeat protein n=1 Tax=Vibrio coralliilyticus TaxID=190893 RepID=UPI001560ED6D|nr:tetratricopeptide repeat protein [Vibrio coralliilyticus]NRF60920.1 tetratricopeptide repeat protein [Vibrio coralliilyticus]
MSDVQEWSLVGFLDELKRIHETIPDRRFVFILGAGASIESNVKGASSLATEWMNIIFRRSHSEEDTNFDKWLASDPLKIEGWNPQNLAAHYPQIFSSCFAGDHESGYAELEQAIEQGSPSFGYAVLAWLLAQDRHNMVVTTNFDNLVADSMYIYGGKTPQVIGHESLASYLKPMSRRPMIAKIHRDLFTDPINDEDGVGELKSSWVDALKNIFRFYTPVFIGYGGNDGSLMNFLNNLETDDISGRPFWCFYEPDGKPNGDIAALMNKHQGILVPAPGFDQLMFKIGTILGYQRNKQRFAVEEHTKQMLDTLEKKIEEVYKESPKEVREKLREVSLEEDKTWLDWEFEAQLAVNDEQKVQIYKAAIEKLSEPNVLELYLSDLLIGLNRFGEAQKHLESYLADFPDDRYAKRALALSLGKQEKYDEAYALFDDLLQLDASDTITLSHYAQILHDAGNINKANDVFYNAVTMDPDNGLCLNNYAYFLFLINKLEEAEKYARKAVKLSNIHWTHFVTLAQILFKKKEFKEALNFVYKALDLKHDGIEALELKAKIEKEIDKK